MFRPISIGMVATYQKRFRATDHDMPISRCVTGNASLAYRKATGPAQPIVVSQCFTSFLIYTHLRERTSNLPWAGEYDATNKNMNTAIIAKLVRDSGIM